MCQLGIHWLLPKIYLGADAFEGLLEEAQRQSLPSFTVPPHSDEITYPKPHVIFRLFQAEDCNTENEGPLLPRADSIVRFIGNYFPRYYIPNFFLLVEENLFQILLTYYRERKECASKLLSYYNKDKVPLFHMIVECMFGSMFRLPDSPTIDIGMPKYQYSNVTPSFSLCNNFY